MYIHHSQPCLWCGLEMRIFQGKFLKRLFFYHNIQSFNEYLIQTLYVASFFQHKLYYVFCQADFNNLYLSKQSFHVHSLENGNSVSCHLMFSSRLFTQVIFLAGPQLAVGVPRGLPWSDYAL